MATFLTFLLLGQVSPGPLDAFRANFASIRADVDYTYEFGNADSRTIEDGRLWKGEVIGFAETRTAAVNGRWSYDGAVERYEGRAPDDALKEGRETRGNGETRPFWTEPFELIFDGEQAAFHRIKGESVDPRSYILMFQHNREPGWISNCGGPFYWWGKNRFPMVIESESKGARLDRAESLVNDSRTEVEIYSQIKPHFKSLEIHYDPSIGYIPRYMRVCGPIDQTTQAVREMYMLDARPCGTGAFIPFEWYAVGYYVRDFAGRYAGYNYKTALRPSYHLISVGHYKAVRMADRKKPVTLEKLAGITTISTNGGAVPLNGVSDRMALDEVETRLRGVIRHPRPSLPAVDIDEIRRFAKVPGRTNRWYVVGGVSLLVLLLLVGFFASRRRWVLFVMIASLPTCSGCGGSPSGSSPRLAAEVSPSLIVYEPNARSLNLTVTVTNKSAGAVRLYRVSGGCSCRSIDERSLPVDLKPDQRVALPLTLADDRSYDPRSFILALSTDMGILEIPVRYLALPRHRISPESINLGTLIDGGDEKERSFELVHREVFEMGSARAGTFLHVPPQFSVESTASHETVILEDSKIAYVDTSYRLTLKDKSYGLNKSIVKLDGLGEGGPAESAIVWQRVPYLSSIPPKASLGTRPLRAFLRCPDETVEFTRVLYAPPGIKAVVSSIREVTIIPEKSAAERIEGIVEVGTTAKDHPPLKIPVFRYAPLSSRNDGGR